MFIYRPNELPSQIQDVLRSLPDWSEKKIVFFSQIGMAGSTMEQDCVDSNILEKWKDRMCAAVHILSILFSRMCVATQPLNKSGQNSRDLGHFLALEPLSVVLSKIQIQTLNGNAKKYILSYVEKKQKMAQRGAIFLFFLLKNSGFCK